MPALRRFAASVDPMGGQRLQEGPYCRRLIPDGRDRLQSGDEALRSWSTPASGPLNRISLVATKPSRW